MYEKKHMHPSNYELHVLANSLASPTGCKFQRPSERLRGSCCNATEKDYSAWRDARMKGFGLLVIRTMPAERVHGNVALGPSLGRLPAPGTMLGIASAGKTGTVRLAGQARLRLTGGRSEYGIILEGPGAELVHEGSIIFEDGTPVQTFTARLKNPTEDVVATARFSMDRMSDIYGFLVIHGDAVTAHVVGDKLPDGVELWTSLRSARTEDGFELTMDQIGSPQKR